MYKSYVFSLYLVIVVLFPAIVFSQELVRYSCLVDRVEVDEFSKSLDRKFDGDGILTTKKKYHALAIAQFGILSYNKFLESKDSVYYKHVINQSKYFKDTTKVHSKFDGKGLGLPYNINFGDLKSPWYSGMTQGYAISFLLRYYSLTNDTEILPVIEKICYLLKLPQSEGGTISTTNGGHKWIEEYPNSAKHKQVLNGSINGIIGLKEYCVFFPNDTSASHLFDELFIGLKSTIPGYDIPGWSRYAAGSKKLSNGYMRYEINQMEHLYTIFKDEFFCHQMMIWSTYAHNKFNDHIMYKRGKYNYSVPAVKFDSLYYFAGVNIDTTSLNSGNENLKAVSTKNRLARYFDGKTVKLKKPKSGGFYIFKIDNEKEGEVIIHAQIESVYDELEFYCYKDGKIEMVNSQILHSENNNYTISVNMIGSQLILKIPKKQQYSDVISVLNILHFDTLNFPYFTHQLSEVFKIESPSKFSCEELNSDKTIVFFKHANSTSALKKKVWKAVDSTDSNELDISESGFCQFLTVSKLSNPYSMFTKIKLSPKEPISTTVSSAESNIF